MAKTIFTMVSAEAFAPRRSKSNRFAKMTVEELADDITAQNELVEANQAEVAVDQIQEAIEEGVEVAEELQEQVDQQDQLIEEAPEQVTEEVVEVAQEAFAYQMGRLQVSYEEFRKHKVTVENYGSTPIAKLKATSEGVKDFIAMIWDKIKSFFKTIWGWLKKLFSSKSKAIENATEQIDDILDKLMQDKLIIEDFKNMKNSNKEKYNTLIKEMGEKYKSVIILTAVFNADIDKQLKVALSTISNMDNFSKHFTGEETSPFDGKRIINKAQKGLETALKDAKRGAIKIRDGYLLFISGNTATGYLEDDITQENNKKEYQFKFSFKHGLIIKENQQQFNGKIDNVFTVSCDDLMKAERKSISDADINKIGENMVKIFSNLDSVKSIVSEIKRKIPDISNLDSKVSKMENDVNTAIEKIKSGFKGSEAENNFKASIYQSMGQSYINILRGAVDFIFEMLNFIRFFLSKIATSYKSGGFIRNKPDTEEDTDN